MDSSDKSGRSSVEHPVREQSILFDALNTGPLVSSLDGAPEGNKAIIDAQDEQARADLKARESRTNRTRIIKFAVIGLILIGGLGLAALRHGASSKTLNRSQTDASQRFPVTSIPLEKLSTNALGLALNNTQALSINGQLNVNNSVVLTPTSRPNNAVTGQLYYDQTTNQLNYYNGSQFTTLLSGNQQLVNSLNGASGALTTGNGLTVGSNTLNNTGVLTLQGENGNVSLSGGTGIAVSGTTLSNSGVLSLGGKNGAIALGTGLSISNNALNAQSGVQSLSAATNNVTVTNQGNGNWTIGVSVSGGSGSGTVASSGGTVGSLAYFAGVQDIENSIISQSGGTVTIAGSLDLGSPLSVSNGGIGVSVLPTNGVLIGNGTSALSGITAGSTGQCLVSTAGAPTFQTCPGSGGVVSVNGLTGALTVAGTAGGSVSSAGTAITINDATSAVKGLASFNSSNLKVTSGSVDTIQGISTSSSPQFGQLTLTSSQATGDMLVVNNTDAGASGNLLNLELNGSSKLSVTPAGTLNLSGLINGQTIGSSANFTGSVQVGSTLTVNTISPNSSLTVGVGGQAFTLQGNTSSSITATNGSNTTTVGFQSPAANVTYSFATAAAGSYNVCTTAGNCVGVGGGVTTAGGTAGTIAKFTGSGAIGNSIITDNGSTVTIGGALAVNTLAPTSALTVGSTGQNLTLQGAAVNLTDTAGGITNSLVFAVPGSSNKTITLPNASGTVAVSAAGPLSLDSSGNLTCPTCLTSGGGGGTAGVTSINSATGALTLQGSTAGSITTAGTTITVNDATSSTKGLASFNATDLTVTSGSVDTVQSIATSATPLFGGLSLTNALTVTNGGTGATGASGARTNLGAAASGANSDITSLSGLTTALSVLQGGTGVSSLTANGVLIGNGTSPVTSVTGSNGQCLMVVSGTPAFGTCPGSGSSPVTSLDGLSGVLTINNTTGAGSTITITNAAADGTTKGIATFNGTNFKDNGSGVINTIQDISTSASPSFAGLSLGTALTISNGGTGATGASSARTNLGAAASGANSDITSLSGLTTALSVLQGGTGLNTLTADEILFASSSSSISQLSAGTSGQCLISNGAGVAPSWQTCPGSGSTPVTGSGTSGKIAVFTGTNAIGNSDITDSGGVSVTVASGVSLQIQGASTFESASNSTSAFQIQDASANNLLAIDTSGDNINLGATGTTALATTVNIATSTGAAQTVHIADGSTETATTTIGSNNGTSSTTLQGGTGGLYLQTGPTASGSTGFVNIQSGNASSGTAGNVSIDTGTGTASSGTTLDNDTFESSVGTWATWFGSITSLVTSSAQAHSGSSSLAVNNSGGNWGIQTSAFPGFTVTPGQVYTFTVWVRGSSVAEGIKGFAQWNTGGIKSNLTSVIDTTTGWTEMTTQAVAPAGVTGVQLYLLDTTGSSDPTVYFDDITIKGGVNTPEVAIGSANAASITLGNTNETGATNIQGGAGGIVISAAPTDAITLGNINSNTITIGNIGSTLPITLQATGISQVITGSGTAPSDVVATSTNSTTAFQIQNSSGATILNVDTSNGVVGTAATSTASTNSQAFAIQSGNAGGTTSTAGNVTINVGTSTTSNGSILIGNAARAQTITIGNSGQSDAISLQSASTLAIISSNLNLSTSGVLTLAGGQTADITTAGSGTSVNAITIQPGTLSLTSGTGANLTLQAGNESGTGSTGGSINIDAGTGASNNNGTVFIGGNTSGGNATVIDIGATSSNSTTITIGKNNKTSNINLKAGSGTINIGEDGGDSNSINIGQSSFTNSGKTDTIQIGNIASVGGNTSDTDNVTIGAAAAITGTLSSTTILQAQGLSDTISGSASAPTDIIKTASGANNSGAFQIQDSGSNVALSVSTNNVASGANAANATIVVGKDSGTGRSINAAGTINASGADYAEYFVQTVPGSLQSGDPVCLATDSTAEPCTSSGSTLIGVVSTNPGYVGNDIFDPAHPDNTALVSMLGQVPVKISDANGQIHVGDMLTFDPATGLAIKATSASMTIGEALDGFSSGTGTVEVYIHVGYYDPFGLQSNGVSNGYVLQGGQATLTGLTVNGTATINTLRVTGSATIASLNVTTSLSTASITVNGHIVTAGAVPTATAGAASGTNSNVSVSGTDTSGKLTITLGTDVTAGELVNLTFASPYTNAPNVVFTAGNTNAALLQPYVSPSAGGFSLNVAPGTGLAAGQTYIFYYHVIQ